MTGRTNRYGFKTFSRTKEEFLQFYESHLEHQMMGLEKKRKKYSKAWIKRVVLTFIGLIVLLLLFLLPDDMETFLKVIIYINIIMVGLGYISFSYMKWQKAIENVVKEEVVPKLVTFMNPN